MASGLVPGQGRRGIRCDGSRHQAAARCGSAQPRRGPASIGRSQPSPRAGRARPLRPRSRSAAPRRSALPVSGIVSHRGRASTERRLREPGPVVSAFLAGRGDRGGARPTLWTTDRTHGERDAARAPRDLLNQARVPRAGPRRAFPGDRPEDRPPRLPARSRSSRAAIWSRCGRGRPGGRPRGRPPIPHHHARRSARHCGRNVCRSALGWPVIAAAGVRPGRRLSGWRGPRRREESARGSIATRRCARRLSRSWPLDVSCKQALSVPLSAGALARPNELWPAPLCGGAGHLAV